MSATYQYAARGDMPPVTLTFHQGEDKPQIWQDGGIPQWPSGCLFIGQKGMILADYSKHVLLPEKAFADFVPPPQTIPNSPGHYAEWIEACKNGSPTSANFEYGGLADRGEPPRQRRVPRRQEAGMGSGQDAGDERARGRPIHQARVPEGMGRGYSEIFLTVLARIRSSRRPCSATEMLIGASIVIQPL